MAYWRIWVGSKERWRCWGWPVSLRKAMVQTVPDAHWVKEIDLYLWVCVRACSVASVVADCNPRNYSPPGSSVYGILHVRILEWVACPPPRNLLYQGSNLSLLHLLHCRQILYSWPTGEDHICQQRFWTLAEELEHYCCPGHIQINKQRVSEIRIQVPEKWDWYSQTRMP